MKKINHKILLILLASVFAQQRVSAQNIKTDSLVKIVKDAYIYGYPINQVYRMLVSAADKTGKGYRPFNKFAYSDKLAVASPDNASKIAALKTTTDRGGAGPNNDTPYFSALLDLSDGPVVLSIPEHGDRYFSLQFVDVFNNNALYIGTRTGFVKAEHIILSGPGAVVKNPGGLKEIKLKTNYFFIIGRTLVEDNAGDLAKVIALQHQITLTPLNGWPSAEGSYSGYEHAGLPKYYASIDSFFVNLQNALKLSPPPAADQPVLKRIALLNAGKNDFDWNNFDADTKQLIHKGLLQTDSVLDANQGIATNSGNGWDRTKPDFGDFGTDYWSRATFIKAGGFGGHSQEEAFYLWPKTDGHAIAFNGSFKYVLHFNKGQFPPLDKRGFWSLTAYEMPGFFLIDNPINRYAIRDRTTGLKYNKDGSLDIYIQADNPGKDQESNWLPIAKGNSTVVTRVYLPKQALLNGSYQLPELKKLN